MNYAVISVKHNGKQVAYADWHFKGAGVLTLSKYSSTKTMIDPVIDIKSGRYIASGKDSAGNKMSAIMSKATAEEHIKKGNAKKGTGW